MTSRKSSDYDGGIAFVVEGTTEKVFYQEYLKWCCRTVPGAKMEQLPDRDWTINTVSKTLLVKFNVMGSVSSIPSATAWIQSTCTLSTFPWTVALCYDTDGDSSLNLNTRSWQRFRQDLKKLQLPVVDLAADADIEDVILSDLDGIRRYLGLSDDVCPHGKKGKSKLNSLFKAADVTRPYHEGEKARELIRQLDFEIIEKTAPIALEALRKVVLDE